MTVVEDPDGKEYDFILKSKTTSTGKQGDILNFNITKTVPDGVSEIKNIILSSIIKDPYSSKYRNV